MSTLGTLVRQSSLTAKRPLKPLRTRSRIALATTLLSCDPGMRGVERLGARLGPAEIRRPQRSRQVGVRRFGNA